MPSCLLDCVHVGEIPKCALSRGIMALTFNLTYFRLCFLYDKSHYELPKFVWFLTWTMIKQNVVLISILISGGLIHTSWYLLDCLETSTKTIPYCLVTGSKERRCKTCWTFLLSFSPLLFHSSFTPSLNPAWSLPKISYKLTWILSQI